MTESEQKAAREIVGAAWAVIAHRHCARVLRRRILGAGDGGAVAMGGPRSRAR